MRRMVQHRLPLYYMQPTGPLTFPVSLFHDVRSVHLDGTEIVVSIEENDDFESAPMQFHVIEEGQEVDLGWTWVGSVLVRSTDFTAGVSWTVPRGKTKCLYVYYVEATEFHDLDVKEVRK